MTTSGMTDNVRQACADYASSVIVKREVQPTGVTIFQNQQFGEVRVVTREDGEPQFCLADLCRVLDLNPSKVSQRLSEDVLSKYPLETAGGTQLSNFVNETVYMIQYLIPENPKQSDSENG